MSSFEPSFQVTDLGSPLAVPGTLVICDGGAAAFVGIDQGQKFLAKFVASSGFELYHPGPEQLAFVEDVIIRPSFKSFTENVPLAPGASQLFVDGGERFIVVSPQNGSVRLLSIVSGQLSRSSTSKKSAFASWAIGAVSRGQFLPILEV